LSRKSTHSFVLPPDLPVRSFSAELESYYECLHRLLCKTLDIPESVASIALLCEHMRGYYYWMREHLEDDLGISKIVAESLPGPVITPTLKLLNEWEQDTTVGQREFESRLVTSSVNQPIDATNSDFSNACRCWHNLRMWIFEADRILGITRNRIALDAPKEVPRKYPWISESHLSFDWDD
jgi:hypothetical protein